MPGAEHARAVRILTVLFAVAVAVSIVHYTDNYLALDRYPQSDSGPTINRDTIWIAWVVLTPFGLGGYLLYRRGRMMLASGLLAVYSLSGLVGLGHYSVPGVGELAWWRHVHIGLDILCGLALLAFAVRSVRRARETVPG